MRHVLHVVNNNVKHTPGLPTGTHALAMTYPMNYVGRACRATSIDT